MMSRTETMRALMELCENDAAAINASTPSTDHADTDETESGDLHSRAETAWNDLKDFMEDNPDLADPDIRNQYLPIKKCYDEAIEALGRDSARSVRDDR